ncbi:hypothetical protein [Escherichia coli]|uniref:hypothetical protein n=1 Tax=Escherichia coli TaxID=562 RepID=UPI001FCEA401|nr:hypothetical protein [Escherichia coli]
MKTLFVTVGPFCGRVSFRVVQGERVLAEDTFHGKCTGTYTRQYSVMATDEDIRVEHDLSAGNNVIPTMKLVLNDSKRRIAGMDEQSPEMSPCTEARYTIKINSSDNSIAGFTMSSAKDDTESLIEKLEGSVAELNKKLSVLIPSEDEKKRRDELFAAFYDYCIEVTRRNFVKIFEEGKSIQ